MYIHIYLHSETGTSHTKYKIQKRSAEGRIEYTVHSLVAKDSNEQGTERVWTNT